MQQYFVDTQKNKVYLFASFTKKRYKTVPINFVIFVYGFPVCPHVTSTKVTNVFAKFDTEKFY
jgi:hypothetical protein